jgi:hypothetical protein
MSMTQATNLRSAISRRLTHHQITKPNGKRITVPSSDKYVAERVLGNSIGLAFARAVAGRDFAK